MTPGRITTDGHDTYPWPIRNVFGEQVTHRTNHYLNNNLEQENRGIKQCYRPICGFKTFATAAGFCFVFDAIRAFLRPQSYCDQPVTLAQLRAIQQERFAQLMGTIATA